MAERRTVTDAVLATTKLDAFIKSGVPTEPPPAQLTVTELSTEREVSLKPTKPPSAKPRRRTVRHEEPGSTHSTDSEAKSVLDDFLVPITTKLRRRTLQALRRAYLEQKLNDRSPATQQEIIEEAVAGWLSGNGFLAE